jgi:hypothetical protein
VARSPNKFINPANGDTYEWPINHQEEEEVGSQLSIQATATSSGVGGFVLQQGAGSPAVLRYSGTILDPVQHDAFFLWTVLCQSQTIVFQDFEGAQYEVIMAFQSRRERVAHNPRGGTRAPNHIWRFSMQMHVVQLILS